ncbi:hypothetical protein RSA46_11675 [Pseudomonas oryzihabitans]|nr:hypothetical protein BJP27_04065 [Pseudomonas psychrotolerans]KTT37938.1 hypothetical protein SB5_19260 [Pseudomonas psychrotolerans]KTT44325.1 hypothetical protein RSA46_11675 [Pseudomonas psychrotolerans]KTT47547.1 hypothetical protein SB11R_19450 [Pseudomonas psychrotolerans]
MKALMLAIFGLLATGSALAADRDPVLIHDQPGFFVHLDIAKVISQTDLTSRCGIVPARLDYLDHQGQEHVMDYLVYGYGCYDDN